MSGRFQKYREYLSTPRVQLFFLILFALNVSAHAIIGGQESTDEGREAQTAVFITRKGDKGSCTGVLVAKDVVLTAAHCLVRPNKEKEIYLPSEIRITFGPKPKDTYLTQTYRADALVLHEGFNFKLERPKTMAQLKNPKFNGDIALIRFAGMRPKASRIAVFGDEIDLKESSVLAVGYGRTDGLLNRKNEPHGSGVLREVELTNISLHNKAMFFLEQPTKGMCHGDLGGPIFVRREKVSVIVGINSAVAGESLRRRSKDSIDKNFCVGRGAGSVATNLIPLREWISSHIHQLQSKI